MGNDDDLFVALARDRGRNDLHRSVIQSADYLRPDTDGLVAPLGLVGVAGAGVLGAAALTAGYVLLGQRYYPIPTRWSRVSLAIAVVLVADVLAIALGSDPFEDILTRLAIGLVGIAVVVFLGPMTVREFGTVYRRLRSTRLGSSEWRRRSD